MQSVTFITGNQSKADYLARYIGSDITHKKVDQDEIQSLDLREVVEHKVRQAFDLVGEPVLVEDTSLEFAALGRLPGTFMKFFMEELSEQELCELVTNNRGAVARCVMAYYDGTTLEFFEASLEGSIADTPVGNNGYGWDRFFIPNGYDVTRAQLNDEDYKTTYLQIKPLAAVKQFLLHHGS